MMAKNENIIGNEQSNLLNVRQCAMCIENNNNDHDDVEKQREKI